MKKSGKKVTLDDLAIMVAEGFGRVDVRLERIDEKLGNVDTRLSKIEGNHERRLEILEDRTQVMKTYFERNPKLKVKFN